MPAKLRIGLVGVGPWGQHILRDLKSLGVVVHACVRSQESLQRARAGGADSIVCDLAGLSLCDGYVVASSTSSHLDIVEVLLQRRKPIFVEKPLINDLDRIERLPAIAADLVFTMHKWRYHPGILELRRIVETGEFGQPLGIRSFRLGTESQQQDVIPVWTLLPHDLSIFLHILDAMPQLKSVWQEPLGPHEGLIARYQVGDVSCVAEVSSGHVLKRRGVVLRCRDAACQLADEDYTHIHIRSQVEGGFQTETRTVASTMPLYTELQAFIAYLQGGPPPLTNLAEETQIVRLITHSIAQAA